MNGYIKQVSLKERLQNLAEQIPQEYRARALADCMNGNPHTFEQVLTGFVYWRHWTSYMNIDERKRQDSEAADIIQAWGEPAQLVHQPNERTASLDEWWNEKYSAVPYSAQPPIYVKGQGFTGG